MTPTRCSVTLIVLMCAITSARAQVDTSIVPPEGRTTWAPGVRGGIPVRTTLCATVQAVDFGNGALEASSAVQAAIAACPAGQVVQLSAGTFLINNYILINKGITLRGAGPGQTRLVKTNGAKPFEYRPDNQQPIIIVGPQRWPKVNDATSVNLSADAVKGTNFVTVANAAGFAPGQFVLLDEDDFNTASWTPLPNRVGGQPSAIWASDRVVFQRHNPSEAIDDPFPASLTWFSRAARPLCEIKEISAVSGNRITFSTPVHIAYTTSKLAQLTRYVDVHVRDAGIEDLTVSGGADGNIRFEVAAYSWMKNVENTFWLGEGVAVNNSFRIEIRDSFIHDASWPYPGGGGYAISLAFAASEVLIENNAVNKANKVMVARSAGAGCVAGYNYMDNGYIAYDLNWVEVGLNASHMVGSHHVLFEGNQAVNYDSDNTHGNAIAMTVFRNHLVGRRSEFAGMSNARGGGLMYGSWWHSFIGNVIGEPGRMNGWVYEDPGDGTFRGLVSYIWKFGYDPAHWEQAADPKVKSTALRDGNFDYLTNQVRWDRAAQTLPASLYLSGKPAFFGSNAWPWVEPVGGTKLGVLPARQRFQTSFAALIPTLSATPNAIASGGTLTVNWRAIPHPSATDWIGLHRPGTPSSSHLSRMYVSCGQSTGVARASGSCTFPLPAGLAAGTYELRLHAADTTNVWVTSNALTVTGGSAGLSLTAAPSAVVSGASLTVNWSGIPNPSATNWISLYIPGAPSTAHLNNWMYLSCSKSAGAAPASGSCAFPVPSGLASGAYELRLHHASSWNVMVTSNPVTVTAGTAAALTLSASPSTLPRGGSLTVSWSGIARPGPTNWIGLYQPGAPSTAHLGNWVYVGCSKTASTARASGSCAFPIPNALTAGQYELRLHDSSSWNSIVTSSRVTVQ
jgi:hypothetical protein